MCIFFLFFVICVVRSTRVSVLLADSGATAAKLSQFRYRINPKVQWETLSLTEVDYTFRHYGSICYDFLLIAIEDLTDSIVDGLDKFMDIQGISDLPSSVLIACQRSSTKKTSKFLETFGIEILPNQVEDWDILGKPKNKCARNIDDIYPLIEGTAECRIHYRGTAILVKRFDYHTHNLVRGTKTATLEGSPVLGSEMQLIAALEVEDIKKKIVVSGSVDIFSNGSIYCSTENARFMARIGDWLLHRTETHYFPITHQLISSGGSRDECTTDDSVSFTVGKRDPQNRMGCNTQLELTHFGKILRTYLQCVRSGSHGCVTTIQLPRHQGKFDVTITDMRKEFRRTEVFRTKMDAGLKVAVYNRVENSITLQIAICTCLTGFAVTVSWIIWLYGESSKNASHKDC